MIGRFHTLVAEFRKGVECAPGVSGNPIRKFLRQAIRRQLNKRVEAFESCFATDATMFVATERRVEPRTGPVNLDASGVEA